MPRPVPTEVTHFTHVSHLATVMRNGLLSDTKARAAGLVQNDIGHPDIKTRRRGRRVPVPPGGVVADYAPFYFAPRSPMMYVIHRGSLATYTGGCDDLVYLVTTVERLTDLRVPLVFTDRNAVLDTAAFTSDAGRLDRVVDWALMRATMWHNTEDQPDRKERRMAECLVYESVPWSAFTKVLTRTPACARQVQKTAATVGLECQVVVRPGWYF